MPFDLNTARPIKFDLSTAKPVAAPLDVDPNEETSRLNMDAAAALTPSIAGAETGLSMGTGMLATPVAGLAGIGQGIKNLFSPGMSAADRVNQVQNALTYEPRSAVGRQALKGATYPFAKLAEGADYVGEGVNKATGSPALATAANTGIQLLPSLLLRGRAPAAKAISTAAEDYVRTRTGLDWSSLPTEAKARLNELAKNQKNLDALDPKALERQIQLETLPVPIKNASKGQLTRDPRQLQQEELLKSTDAGQELVGDALEQNRKISENIDLLRNKTGGKSLSDIELGRKIQDENLRAKQSSVKANVKALYDDAEAAGEKAGVVDTEPLRQFLKEPLNRRNLPSLEGDIKAYAKDDGAMTVKQMEDLRQDLTAERATPSKSAHYAGKAIKVIDDILDQSGGPAYKKARAAFKAERTEFGEQSAVERLVEDKSRTDRTTALEDTHNRVVVQGSAEQLAQVRDSLIKGGTSETRIRGAAAWKDLAATTIENIKAEATKGITNQAGEANSTYASLKRAIDRVGDEKLQMLIGKESTAQLRQILKATETLKTEPGGIGVRGSNTVNKIMNILDKTLITKIPGVGPTTEGVLRAVGKVTELGKGGREVRAAKEQPLPLTEAQKRLMTPAQIQAAERAALLSALQEKK